MLAFNDLNRIKEVLKVSATIAVVGFSPKEQRPSNMVGRYLIRAGFKVIPVNPGQSKICGLICYPNLSEIPEKIDIVNIFRRGEDVLPIAREAVRIGAKAVWMQQGVMNDEAAEYAMEAGLFVVMDRCIKVDHETLL